MKVWPKNDAIKSSLKHVPTGKGFGDDGTGDWPEDNFTHRRIRDGDLLTQAPGQPPRPQQPTPAPQPAPPTPPPPQPSESKK